MGQILGTLCRRKGIEIIEAECMPASLKKYVWRGYEYGAVNYFLKPVKYSVLKMELDRYFARYQGKDEPYMSFQNDNGKYKVLYKNLCYAETEKRHVMLHFEGQQQIIYKNMKDKTIKFTLCANFIVKKRP